MRRIDFLIGAAALVVASVSVTFWLASRPQGPREAEVIEVGAEKPMRYFSPRELLRKPAPTPKPLQADTASTAPAPLQRPSIEYPNWMPGSMRVEGQQPITSPEGFAAPTWSPTGLDVAFTKAGNVGVYISAPKPGATPRMLTDAPQGTAAITWNLDGMSLVAREPDGRLADLVITGEKYPAPERPERVYESDGVIYFQPDEGEAVRISGTEDSFTLPHLSPDGALVAYSGRETGLYIARVDGTRFISVGRGAHAGWLPDSSGIIYDIVVEDGSTAVDGDLWYASADGRERTNLTNTPGVAEMQPSVSPDGGRIAFACGGQIFVGALRR